MHPDVKVNGSTQIYDRFIKKVFKAHEESIDRTLAGASKIDIRGVVTAAKGAYTAVSSSTSVSASAASTAEEVVASLEQLEQ